MEKLKYIKIKDVFSCILFLIVLPIAIIYKLFFKITKRNVWLISEYKDSARDNAYCFFKYIMKNHREQECYYVIDKKSNDYNKVKNYNNIIQFGSFKHWVLYLAVDKNITAVKDCSPNHLLFTVLHQKLNMFNNIVFLQHGVILSRFPMFYYKNTKFKLFICGAKNEYEEIKENYGYPNQNVIYTGLARFDNLIDSNSNKKQLLIIPTWRRWLGRDTNSFVKNINFQDTIYYKRWNELFKNKKFCDYLLENDIIVKFYPHKCMHKFINEFDIKCQNIKVVDNSKEDIQKLLKESSLMVTDYSSVCSDFAFMQKPIVFYQFDKEDFYSKHADKGYFDFENDGFGPVFDNSESIVNSIIEYIENDYKIQDRYLSKMKSFFELHDNNNCKRIYNAIKNLK